ARPEALPLLYRDTQVVVIDKPSGLLVHRSPIDRHERRFAVQLLRDQLGQRVYPAHRLDKGTSGALAFALDRESGAALAGQFATGAVRKRYVAIVRGWPEGSGLIDHPLDPVEDDVLGPQAGGPREAQSTFRTLATVELPHRVDRYPTSRYALVELEPLTGRRHQLRRHLAHVSHPIIGDSTYGKGRHNRLFRVLFGSQRLLLACTQLAFRHPVSGAPIVVDAALAPEFAAVVRRLGWPVA
ncbi:MAG TPA: pseudouridine synthase, partial [Steroidobacteraceae bacterium]